MIASTRIFFFLCASLLLSPIASHAKSQNCANEVIIPTDSIKIEPLWFKSKGSSAVLTTRYGAESPYYVAVQMDKEVPIIVGPVIAKNGEAS